MEKFIAGFASKFIRFAENKEGTDIVILLNEREAINKITNNCRAAGLKVQKQIMWKDDPDPQLRMWIHR